MSCGKAILGTFKKKPKKMVKKRKERNRRFNFANRANRSNNISPNHFLLGVAHIGKMEWPTLLTTHGIFVCNLSDCNNLWLRLIVFTEKEAFWKSQKAKFLIFLTSQSKKKQLILSYSPVIHFKMFGSRDILLTLIVKKRNKNTDR